MHIRSPHNRRRAAFAVTFIAGFVSAVLFAVTHFAESAKPLPGAGDPVAFAGGGIIAPEYVEQQSLPLTLEHREYCFTHSFYGDGCTYNFTGCPWTADDRIIWGGMGTMPPGHATSLRQCLIADGFMHINGINVQTPSPDLVVTIHFEPQNVAFRLPSHVSSWAANTYENRGCIVGPYYGDRSLLQEIPDSVGSGGQGHGLGVQTTITVTVTNPTGRKLRGVSVQYVLGSSEPSRQAQFCQGGDPGEAFTAGDGSIWSAAV